MDKEQILKNLKAELRSLVVSNPAEMRCHQLAREYHDMNGRRVPYEQFGYGDLASFLRAECGDAFQLRGDSRNPTLCPIITDNIRKLNDLITRQRSTTPKGRTPLRKRNAIIQSPNDFHTPQTTNQKHKSFHDVQFDSDSRVNSASSSFSGEILLSDVNKRMQNSPRPSPSVRKNVSLQNGSIELKKTEVLNNINLLLNEHPAGLAVDRVDQLYEKKFNCKIEYNRIGVQNVRDLFEQPAFAGGAFVTFKINGAWIVTKSRKDTSSRHSFDKYALEASTSDALPFIDLDVKELFKGCMMLSDNIETEPLLENNTCYEIYIAQVADLSHFWFHVNTQKQGKMLEFLHSDMNEFYNNNPHSYALSEDFVKVGQLCAIPYGNIYHRAKIVKVYQNGWVKVNYIDFCTIAEVHISNIKLLMKEFAVLPTQAIRGCLAYVKPVQKNWSEEAINLFLRVTCDKKLNAYVLHVDKQNMMHAVDLYYMHNGDRIFITEIFDQRNMAKEIGQLRVVDPESVIKFELLENGEGLPEQSKSYSDNRTSISTDHETFRDPIKQVTPSTSSLIKSEINDSLNISDTVKYNFTDIKESLEDFNLSRYDDMHRNERSSMKIVDRAPVASSPLLRTMNNYVPNQRAENTNAATNYPRLYNDIEKNSHNTTNVNHLNNSANSQKININYGYENSIQNHPNLNSKESENSNLLERHQITLHEIVFIADKKCEVWLLKNISETVEEPPSVVVIAEQFISSFFRISKTETMTHYLYKAALAVDYHFGYIVKNRDNIIDNINECGNSGCSVGKSFKVIISNNGCNLSNVYQLLFLPLSELMKFLLVRIDKLSINSNCLLPTMVTLTKKYVKKEAYDT